MCKRMIVTFVGILLLTSSIPAFAQEVLYTEDFEAGAVEGWELEGGWRVDQDEGNLVLSGEGHHWARLQRGQDWTDYTFQSRLKLIRGRIHLNYRVSEEGRYFIGFRENGLYLNKETPWGKFFELAASDMRIGFDVWHDIEIRGGRGNIQVYVDGLLAIEVTDDTPLTMGSIAFETIEDSFAYIDNVEVNVKQRKREINVVGEGSYNRAATILTPLYMYYLERYFSGVSDETDLGLYIRSVLDESRAGREMLERALANYKAIPLETRYEMYDAEVVSMTAEGNKPINLSYIKDRLAEVSPILGLDIGGAPTAPSNLIAKNTSAWDQEFPQYEITLKWQSNSNNEDGFRIYRVFKPGKTMTQKLALVATVGNVTTYRDVLTKPANKTDLYCYDVRAYRVSPVALVGQTPKVYESGPSNSTCESYSTSPPPKPSDTDGDGVPDCADECPSQKGVLTHGCPDKDSDGIPNKDDFCPSQPGLSSGKYIPKNRHGCPQRYNLRWMGMKVLNNSAAYAFPGITVLPDKKLYDNEKHNDNNYGAGEEPYLVFSWNNGFTSKGMLEQGSARWCCGEGVGVDVVKKGEYDEPDTKPFGEEPSNPPLNSLRNTGLAIWPPVDSEEIDTKLGLGVSTTLMERDYDATITVKEESDVIEAAFKIGGKVAGTVAGCVSSGGLGCLISIGTAIKSVVEDILGLSQPKKTVTVNDHDDPQGTDFWAITASDAATRTAANGAYPFYFPEMPTDARWFCTWIPCNVGQRLPRYMRIKPYYCLCREGMSDSEIKQNCARSNANVVLPWPMKAP